MGAVVLTVEYLWWTWEIELEVPSMTKSEVTDIECKIIQEKEKCIVITNGENEMFRNYSREKWYFLPKSLTEYDKQHNGKVTIITIPVWLAEEKGLV